ncbi:hypothetical protein K458DRAFT_488648 [Lentithecium fluviatile CBS 122367]|uniref:GPI anchored cell wall protein n=1 Tax=Lentithecium fluviatile CBS 122367 TaxID=1168545 RepID=A0A6G1IVW8_9PLEO|nr:hypothetical protein K458DRAFT_488648 [Lentithecium fluviatile CBS 122367]
MKAFTTLAVASALLSTGYAATVKIEETPCIQNNTELKTFDVEIGKLLVGQIESVCGLKIISATDADVTKVECQAFKDAEGKDPGSAKFTQAKPALIATNPVQEGSIKCILVDGSGSSSGVTTSTTLITATGTGTGTGTGIPAPTGGNSTVSVTGTPTQPGSPTSTSSSTSPENSNNAGRVGLSVGALAVGVAALVL